MKHLNLLAMLCCILLVSHNANATTSQPVRVLVGSPVRKSPGILKEFLSSLQQIKQENIILDYCFVDDNINPASSELLQKFAQINHCFISKAPAYIGEHVCDETTHVWTHALVWKVTQFKNSIIQRAIQYNYDYLFFIDSDLLIHPDTVEHLINTKKDIISEIFWTKWQPDRERRPQVWLCDDYTLGQEFIEMLKKPGIYEVGGLGACTLISKKALNAGVNFNKLYNLTFGGEDRHFCVRAVALGFTLYVDTHFPAYHIFRESELAGVETFKKNNNLR
jgi:glycosyltransferase involved in cell wall biosynthesis